MALFIEFDVFTGGKVMINVNSITAVSTGGMPQGANITVSGMATPLVVNQSPEQIKDALIANGAQVIDFEASPSSYDSGGVEFV
jgi:hypothetical protein